MIGIRNATTNAVGLCLLPSELIQNILLRLPLPELFLLKSVSKTLRSVILEEDFRRECDSRSSSETWLFVYKKRSSPRDSALHGFTDRSDRWFRVSVVKFLLPVVSPGDDLFFLAASGDFFLFASNSRGELIAVNFTLNTVKKLPPSPLGPRGTSSWRRSGLKLIAGPSGSDRFRFLFAELHENRPVLFQYSSESDGWCSVEARENEGQVPRGGKREEVFLSVVHGRNDSILLTARKGNEQPVIVRPRFDIGRALQQEEQLAIGFSTSNAINRIHVFGDGYVAVVRSESVSGSMKVRRITWIEVQGLSVDGRRWEFVSKVPNGMIERLQKPYVAMVGCLEERDGIIRLVMVSNYEGMWDMVWLCYDVGRRDWKWVQLPECSMRGCNMAGITLSSGLTLG